MKTTREFKGTIGVNEIKVIVTYNGLEIESLKLSNSTGEQLIHNSVVNFEKWVSKMQLGLGVDFSIANVGTKVTTVKTNNCEFPMWDGVNGTILSIIDNKFAEVDLGSNVVFKLELRQLQII